VQNVLDLATGKLKYPWEREEQPPGWAKSRVRPTVEACLTRDARARLTAAQLLASVKSMGHSTSLVMDR
jgi:hypothetical protein